MKFMSYKLLKINLMKCLAFIVFFNSITVVYPFQSSMNLLSRTTKILKPRLNNLHSLEIGAEIIDKNDRNEKTSSIPLKNRLYLYNTLSKDKQLFKTIDVNNEKVSFYSCGPTVYDYAHIGNFRAFLTYDILKRWLEYTGYKVDHVCNLTDVDDKIIVKMAAEGKSLKEITELYTNAFFEDLDVLNIKRAG